ncbi:LADA_0A08988g1_1 [Lachancea dasiensis]|uniref:LADA_0A08988g1_1 n=1 Tax=Lachancea dasiensis TaxID=1072105 RepID=A0A1G4IQZ9_9SACH|nr:LADA_0A08988g1_1 [Lachancea dasiensis]
MVKKAGKVSKHSRAARRLEFTDTEAQSLAELPRAQNLDVTNKLIRTASKNEQLLEAKMKKKQKTANKVGKKVAAKSALENLDNERIARALNVSHRLDGKVERAKSRAKYVQGARKAGWDSTNESIRRDLAKLTGQKAVQENSGEEGQEDAMEDDDAGEDESGQESQAQETRSVSTNVFGLLSDDVEA